MRRYTPDPPPEAIAAALLHDSAEFAPPHIDLDATLDTLSPDVARIVRVLEQEHDDPETALPPADDPSAMLASGADKIVSIGSVIERAEDAPDPAAFWASRQEFVAALPYFARFADAAEGVLPSAMVAELSALVARARALVAAAAVSDPDHRA